MPQNGFNTMYYCLGELREKESDMRGPGDIVVPGVCVRMGGVSCMGESSGQPYPATTFVKIGNILF